MSVKLSEIIVPAFFELWSSIRGHEHSDYWLSGGRGSTKSSFISIAIVMLIMKFSWANAVIVRRFSNTLRDSVYQQMLWAIDMLGVSDYFKASLSPLEIVYKPTGQRIVFRGLDDPKKAKGVKFTKGYCAIQWFEELDQINSWEDVRSALKSFKRGGSVFWTFYSYNPPKTLWNWVNQQAIEMESKPGAIVHHSTYLDVIEGGHSEWLGLPFIDDAEWLKETNEQAYRWEMLGEITGTGGNVFDNIVAQAITDEEIATFDNFRNGVDWGWFPDPWCFVRGHYSASEKRLYIFEERRRNKTLPRDTGKIIVDALTYPDARHREPVFHNELIWCDDTADGKQQMATYRRLYGLAARPARKGNMRDLSYQWLAGLREIVIDPQRCPDALKEFRLKEYAKDKDDNWINQIPDGNDHAIDATRYMMMNDVLRAA